MTSLGQVSAVDASRLRDQHAWDSLPQPQSLEGEKRMQERTLEQQMESMLRRIKRARRRASQFVRRVRMLETKLYDLQIRQQSEAAPKAMAAGSGE